MMNPVQFAVPTSGYRHSATIWASCPILELIQNPGKGTYFFDDGQKFPLTGTQTTQIGHGFYKVFATTGSAVTRVSAVNSVELPGGTFALTTDTDNDSASMAQAYPNLLMSGLTSNSGKLWFECEIAQKSVLTNMASTIIGLAETEQWTLATAVPLNASDALTNSASFIGFNLLEDGLGVINTCYSDRAAAAPTNIGAAEGGTLTAYTFKKLGMLYDPNDATRCVRFFADGVELATAMTRAALIAMTNLDANALGLIIATCADSAGTAHELYLRWWECAQLYPGN